jgi:hypothetical protein
VIKQKLEKKDVSRLRAAFKIGYRGEKSFASFFGSGLTTSKQTGIFE